MTDYLTRARMQAVAERRAYEEAVAALTPAQLAVWNRVLVNNEWFDGEDWAALGMLQRLRHDGALGPDGGTR